MIYKGVETVIWWLGPSHHTLFHSLAWVHRLWCKFLSDGWDSLLSACTPSSCQLKNILHPGTRILWKHWWCWPVMWARPLPTPTNRWLHTVLLTVCLPSFRWAPWWSVLLGLDLFSAFFPWCLFALKQWKQDFQTICVSLDVCGRDIIYKTHWNVDCKSLFSPLSQITCDSLTVCFMAYSQALL